MKKKTLLTTLWMAIAFAVEYHVITKISVINATFIFTFGSLLVVFVTSKLFGRMLGLGTAGRTMNLHVMLSAAEEIHENAIKSKLVPTVNTISLAARYVGLVNLGIIVAIMSLKLY